MSVSRVESMLTDTICFSIVDGINNAGDPSFSTPCAIIARVERDAFTEVDPDGNERQITHRVSVTTEVPIDSRVWLDPTDTSDISVARRVAGVKSAKTPYGFELFELLLGS